MKVSPKLITTTASIIACAGPSSAFISPTASRVTATAATPSCRPCPIVSFMSSSDKDDDMTTNKEGEDLAAAFFKAVKDRDISFEGDEIDFADAEGDEFDEADDNEDDEDDALFDDDDDEDDEINIPQGAVEAFIDKDAKASSISNDQIYNEMKDRMFESAGRFVAMTKGLYDDDSDDNASSPKEYTPPSLIPDPGMSAGEVVTAVLDALRNNDIPHPNRGIETLFGFSSPSSQVSELRLKGLKPQAYYDFLAEMDESKAFFTHKEVVIAKADYSPDGTRAFITARLFGETSPDGLAVNFILSTTGDDEEDCWLVDSMRTPPPSRRGGRRNRR